MDLNKTLVESSNDILREILVRLPPKSMFRFTCVSRRWNSLIMDPCFIKRYDSERRSRRKGTSSSGGRLLGFVQSNTMILSLNEYIFCPWVSRHSFLSVGEDGHSGLFPRELGYFISSSNGLFLCGCLPTTYYVGNPMTKRWVSLPSPHGWFRSLSAGLTCEEDTTDYKVVLACASFSDQPDSSLIIETYSSITGKWRVSTLVGPCFFRICCYEPPTVIGGVFHWFTEEGGLVIYDSSTLEDSRGKHHLQFIHLPWVASSRVVWRTDDGQTLCYGASNLVSLEIFHLQMGKHSSCNRWTLEHKVGMATLMKDLIPITKEDIAMERRLVAGQRSSEKERSILYKDREYVYMVAFLPWDPRLVLVRLRERIFLYDSESKTIDSVQLHGCPSFTDFEWEWYPYFDSVSLSSYAFGLEQQQQQHTLPILCGGPTT